MEILIEKVRKHPILWDANHTYFRDVGKKRDVWDVVADECGFHDGEEARQAWARIRNSHREAMRRRLEDRPDLKRKPWRFEKQMEFLLANLDIRKAPANSTENSKTEKVSYEYEIEPNESFGETHVATEEVDTYSYEDEPFQNPVVMELKEEKKIHRKTRKPSVHSDSSEAEFDSNERNEKQQNKRQANDERVSDGLNELFSGLCEKTRNLPKYLQLRVQREIFESVTKAEEEALGMSNPVVSRNSAIAKRKLKMHKRKFNVTKALKQADERNTSRRQFVEVTPAVDVNKSHKESPIDPIGNIPIKTEGMIEDCVLEEELSL